MASNLRQLMTLQQETRTADGSGGYVRSWSDIADLWAELIPWQGKDMLRGAQMEPEVTHRIILRYRAGVAAGQRLSMDRRNFYIRYVMDDARGEKLQLVTQERAD